MPLVLLLTTLAAADVDAAPRGDVDSDSHAVEPAPLWQFFLVPAGLSITSSVLLAVPQSLLLFISPTLTTVSIVVAAPVVAAVGTDRLDPGNARGAVVGLVVGDVVGAAAGVGVGVVFYLAVFDGRVSDDVLYGPVTKDLAVLGACAVVSAWVFRAVGSGVGAGVGRLLTLPE